MTRPDYILDTPFSDFTDLGVFGNVWIRQHHFHRKGDTHAGHFHFWDHVTVMQKGGVACKVKGLELPQTEFWTPSFIVIKKQYQHRFTALVDDTVFSCIFALRDEKGQVTDAYTGDHSPYGGRRMTRAEVEAALNPTCIACDGCEVSDHLKGL